MKALGLYTHTHTGSLKENKKKNIKGITLVALVVTIIILLILAGISITALTQTGLFGKAKQAKQKSKDAQELENSTLGSYENSINEIVSTGSREESDNNNQYSLEEKTIGTWIDGKKLYRKVYVIEDFSSSSQIDLSNLNYDYIQVSSRIKTKDGAWREMFCYPDGNCIVDGIASQGILGFDYANNNYYNGGTVYSIVEYTKK